MYLSKATSSTDITDCGYSQCCAPEITSERVVVSGIRTLELPVSNCGSMGYM